MIPFARALDMAKDVGEVLGKSALGRGTDGLTATARPLKGGTVGKAPEP